MNLRDAILKADDLPTESVHIPEWDMTVYVRSMTGVERDDYDSFITDIKDLSLKEKMSALKAKMIILCTVDDKGNRVFTDDDVDALGGKNSKPLLRLYDAANLLNAVSEKEVEEIAKN